MSRHRRMLRHRKTLALLLAGVGAASVVIGCASTPTKKEAPVAEEKVFFPAKPSPPRLQFLTSITEVNDWGKGKAAKKEGSFAKWVAGDEKGAASSTRIDTPYGIDAYNGKVYICDMGRKSVHVIDAVTGSYSTLGKEGTFSNPINITIDHRDGTKYVCDNGHGSVIVFNAADKQINEFGSRETMEPLDLAIRGDELYIVDSSNGQIEVWSKDGKPIRTFGRQGMGPDELDKPTNIAIGPDNRLYISDTMAQQVKIFGTDGTYQGSIGQPGSQIGSFARPKGIAIDKHNHVYVSDAQWRVVQVFTGDDKLLTIISGMGGKAPGIVLPAGLAIDDTSLKAFQKYLDPDFEAEYLLFLVNQHGRNKVSVYAYGKSKSVPASQYEIQPLPPRTENPPVAGSETAPAPGSPAEAAPAAPAAAK